MGDSEANGAWEIQLLTREAEYEQNLLAKNWAYICATLTGIAIPMAMNHWLKRPLRAGIQRHFMYGACGFGIGHLMTEREKFVLARRDAMLRHYIQLHPEDFPPPDRKKWGEIFEHWEPIR